MCVQWDIYNKEGNIKIRAGELEISLLSLLFPCNRSIINRLELLTPPVTHL